MGSPKSQVVNEKRVSQAGALGAWVNKMEMEIIDAVTNSIACSASLFLLTLPKVRHSLSLSPWSQTNWERIVTPFHTIAPGSATPLPTKLSCVFVQTLSVFTYEHSQLRSKVEVGIRTTGLQQHRTVVGNLEDKVKLQSGFSVRRTTEVRPVISAL